MTDPDARDFLRKYLGDPADATARLVFADWLEETGRPANRAWAYYIRLRVELALAADDDASRRHLAEQLADYARRVRARLTVPAQKFVAHPRSLLDLLPARNIWVRLWDHAIPPAVVDQIPESVARECRLIPLLRQDETLVVAAADPEDANTLRRLEFIVPADVVAVGADPDDLADAHERHYGLTDTTTVDSILYDFVTPPPR